MNDADEDDLDVYDHAAGHGKSRTAFDVNDVQDEEHLALGARGSAIPSRKVTAQITQSRNVSAAK